MSGFNLKQWFVPPESAPEPKPRIKVLVIDDSEDFRTLIHEVLTPLCFDVLAAENPVKALELYAREKDNIHLVLLDYYMPQLNGQQTLDWLHKLNPQVRIIMCSGADALHLRQLQANRKIDGYLQKPFWVKDAQRLIDQVLAHA